MMLVAGRLPSLPSCGDDVSMQGILKSGPTRRSSSKSEQEVWRPEVPRCDDSKRLVRFCEETEYPKKDSRNERSPSKETDQNVIRFGSSTYVINNSDPNSAVRKLFPNSKLTPINPITNRSNPKEHKKNYLPNGNRFENENSVHSRLNLKSFSQGEIGTTATIRKVDRNVLRKNNLRTPPDTKPKPNKRTGSSTPLIERIKQLTCEDENISSDKEVEKYRSSKLGNNIEYKLTPSNYFKHQEHTAHANKQQTTSIGTKLTNEGVNLMRYNQNISHTRSQHIQDQKSNNPNKTDEARRLFLSSLAQSQDGKSEETNSIAGSSSTGDTVYSLSDIEEALTDEEKEIKDAFFHENKQDELELFVQQGAGRTERLRKRYSTPKSEIHPSVKYSNNNTPEKLTKSLSPYFLNNPNVIKEKPKFGSTIEILQQLQQQIEIPYQLEGRRTACSNYSDSSIPVSDRFYDESSDGYEPIIPKSAVHRTCSLDSKNYEEIDNFPSAFSVPRTKSQEHPRLTYLDSDPYGCTPNSLRYLRNCSQRNPSLELGFYASSPNLHSHHQSMFPDRVSSYNNLPVIGRQLHPVLQQQYCRYPATEHSSPAEEGKVLTPPVRMHTYMNVPNSAPCYMSPPPYSHVNNYMKSPVPAYNEVYDCEAPHAHSNIYQNVPTANPNLMTLRRLCTERERGVPEGASSTTDLREVYSQQSTILYPHANTLSMPKHSTFAHQYCVDV